jgi:hypothetical protein
MHAESESKPLKLHAYPFPMIVSIAVSVIAGALMARRRTPT